MNSTSIQPGSITRPIQVIGAFLAALVLLVSALVGGAALIEAEWLQGVLIVSGILAIPFFIGACFLLLTLFRPQMQEDQYYALWLERTEQTFIDFAPENALTRAGTGETRTLDGKTDAEGRRIRVYESQRGLFLIHSWRPSALPHQLADIVIELHQHGEGPLATGQVRSVEYQLGPKFFSAPVAKTDASDNFRLEVAAYSPMACLARVNFSDGSPPLELNRYINF